MQFSSGLTITAIILSILPSILGAPLSAHGSITNGTPCFGSSAPGCTLVHGQKRETEELLARDPEPVAEPQSGVIGNPCFGSAATGCTLKHGHKREEDLVTRDPEPVAEPNAELVAREPGPTAKPQGVVIGEPCFGSTATGCTLKQDRKREE